ncbi:MAG TPA: MerR family transcriptional regulator [Actinocrinis sp.]
MSTVLQGATVWTVAELARRAHVSADTVRYYERAGLLPCTSRSPAGYRHFSEADLDRLRFIQGAQRLGLRLREIRELLQVRDTGTCPCEPAETLLRRRVAEIDQELVRLTALRADLERMLTAIPGPRCPDPEPGTWCPPVLTAHAEGR